ncbi:uracil-DNA glycosylase family protein [Litoreibacter sp.]|nr:uracil-DNA glycosylase family protein [Litoreibacter sp.]
MSEDLQALSAMMRKCTICEGLELGPKPIFKLSPNANILIAGQAPGRITHHKGRPFDDPSGERLRAWLGIDRPTFYDDDRIGIFPMGLCFPGSGKSGDIAPRAECVEAWRTRVMAQLEGIELTLILGQYAIAWHLPHLKNKPVTEAVKLSADGANGTFVLPHPSPRNNRWLRRNDWFEQEVIPQIQSEVARLLA